MIAQHSTEKKHYTKNSSSQTSNIILNLKKQSSQTNMTVKQQTVDTGIKWAS